MVAMEGIADSRHDRVVAEALDRTDLSTVESNRKGDARASGGTVDQHRTGSAHAVLATEMGAGEVLLHTEEIAETGAWLDRRGMLLAIDSEGDVSHEAVACRMARRTATAWTWRSSASNTRARRPRRGSVSQRGHTPEPSPLVVG